MKKKNVPYPTTRPKFWIGDVVYSFTVENPSIQTTYDDCGTPITHEVSGSIRIYKGTVIEVLSQLIWGLGEKHAKLVPVGVTSQYKINEDGTYRGNVFEKKVFSTKKEAKKAAISFKKKLFGKYTIEISGRLKKG